MIERRAQHLVNVVYFKLARDGYPQTAENIEHALFFMSDTEFNEIMNMSDKESMKFYNENFPTNKITSSNKRP